MISTRLHGLWLIFNWCFKIPSHASLHAFVDPGRENIYVFLYIPPNALDCIVEVPILVELIWWKRAAKPSIFFSKSGSMASGVLSLPVSPVPPVVIITSAAFSDVHSLRTLRISSILSFMIILLNISCPLCLIASDRYAPEVSLSKFLVSEMVIIPIFKLINLSFSSLMSSFHFYFY